MSQMDGSTPFVVELIVVYLLELDKEILVHKRMFWVGRDGKVEYRLESGNTMQNFEMKELGSNFSLETAIKNMEDQTIYNVKATDEQGFVHNCRVQVISASSCKSKLELFWLPVKTSCGQKPDVFSKLAWYEPFHAGTVAMWDRQSLSITDWTQALAQELQQDDESDRAILHDFDSIDQSDIIQRIYIGRNFIHNPACRRKGFGYFDKDIATILENCIEGGTVDVAYYAASIQELFPV